MSRISTTSSLSTKNIISQYVNLTDELKIDLEYDIHTGLLNILVKNTGSEKDYPSQINVLSKEIINETNVNNEINDVVSFREHDDEPKICIELSTIYVYDLDDENEIDMTSSSTSSELCLCSSSSSSSSLSCFDDQTIDNDDDGYSTHSLDDIDHQSTISIPTSKLIQPFVSSYRTHAHFSEDNLLSIARLIDRMMWLNPFRKLVKQMLNSSISLL